LPELPATSPSFCAIYAPAGRLSSLKALSPLATVTGTREKTVFTYTQMAQQCHIILLDSAGYTFRIVLIS
jgi:hypothetical protein